MASALKSLHKQRARNWVMYFQRLYPSRCPFSVFFLSGTMLCWLVMAIELEVYIISQHEIDVVEGHV